MLMLNPLKVETPSHGNFSNEFPFKHTKRGLFQAKVQKR